MRAYCIGVIVALCCVPAGARQNTSGPAALASPVIHSDGHVTFNLYAPAARKVSVRGDYPIGIERTMARDASGVWSVTLGPLRDDFYTYQFAVDDSPVLDPRNPVTTRDGTRILNWAIVPGPNSDRYTTHAVPHGRITAAWYPAPTLGMTRRMLVYTPPDYDANDVRYPVLYLLHGGGGDEEAWRDMGRAPQIFDNLIARHEIVPMIVVMGNGNAWQPSTPNDVEASAPAPASEAATGLAALSQMLVRYPASLVEELIPYIDTHFRTRADPDSRAIAGLSMGGAQSCHAALTHLDKFGWVGLFSSAVPLLPGVHATRPKPADAAARRGPGLGETIDASKFVARYPVVNAKLNEQLHLFYVGVGRADGLAEFEDDFAKLLDARGVKYVSFDLADYGHDWNYWRLALQDFAKRLFRAPPSALPGAARIRPLHTVISRSSGPVTGNVTAGEE